MPLTGMRRLRVHRDDLDCAAAHPSRVSTPERARIRLVDGSELEIALEHARAVDVAVEVAARQRRVISYAQLRAAGATRSAVAHWTRAGRLHRWTRGVYLVGHPDPLPLAPETAALLATGPDAALCAATASGRWQVTEPATGLIHVLVAGRKPRPAAPIAVHLTATLDPRDVRILDGLPVTSPARTLLDLAAMVGRRDLHWAVEEARVRRLVTTADLVEQLERTPRRRGAGRLRDVITESAARTALTRSAAERRLLDLLRAAQLPAPETNVRVRGFEVDAFWREHRLVVEIDGFAFHSTRAAFERDRRRDATLQAAGLRVIRLTWRHLSDEPERVVALVAGLLERGRA